MCTSSNIFDAYEYTIVYFASHVSNGASPKTLVLVFKKDGTVYQFADNSGVDQSGVVYWHFSYYVMPLIQAQANMTIDYYDSDSSTFQRRTVTSGENIREYGSGPGIGFIGIVSIN